ncbi:hypothetical protein L9F63_006794, partial [Diploptera punctata]
VFTIYNFFICLITDHSACKSGPRSSGVKRRPSPPIIQSYIGQSNRMYLKRNNLTDKRCLVFISWFTCASDYIDAITTHEGMCLRHHYYKKYISMELMKSGTCSRFSFRDAYI